MLEHLSPSPLSLFISLSPSLFFSNGVIFHFLPKDPLLHTVFYYLIKNTSVLGFTMFWWIWCSSWYLVAVKFILWEPFILFSLSHSPSCPSFPSTSSFNSLTFSQAHSSLGDAVIFLSVSASRAVCSIFGFRSLLVLPSGLDQAPGAHR